jgi:hypothetical protein
MQTTKPENVKALIAHLENYVDQGVYPAVRESRAEERKVMAERLRFFLDVEIPRSLAQFVFRDAPAAVLARRVDRGEK